MSLWVLSWGRFEGRGADADDLCARRSAKAVTLEDAIPSNATLLDGSLSVTFPRIAEGSSVKHTYTMAFTTGGAGMVLPTASVKYNAEEGSVQVCLRTSRLWDCRWRLPGGGEPRS